MVSINGNGTAGGRRRRKGPAARNRRKTISREEMGLFSSPPPFPPSPPSTSTTTTTVTLSSSSTESLLYRTEKAMIYFLSNSFLFSPREPTRLRRLRCRSVNSSPSFSSVSPVAPERVQPMVAGGTDGGDDFRSANVVSLLMNFSVR